MSDVNRVADKPRISRGVSRKEQLLYVVCGLATIFPAREAARAIFILLFYGKEAYFTEGLRFVGRSVLSNGEQLPIGRIRFCILITWMLWVAFIAPLALAARRFFLNRPDQPAEGQAVFYRYAAVAYPGRCEEGLVEAQSLALAESLLRRAKLVPYEIRLASVKEIQSHKLKRFSAELHGSEDVTAVSPTLWHPEAPENYVLPAPSGKCKARLHGAYVDGTLNLAKRGTQSCVLFTRKEGWAKPALEIFLDQITRIDIKRFPFKKLRIGTKLQGDFEFSGDVLKIGSVFQFVLANERNVYAA